MSTPEENKALFRRTYEELLNQGNLSIADELVAPDFINHEAPRGETVAHSVSALSKLVGSTSSSMLMVDNNGAGTALDLQVGPPATPPEQKASAPMRVDSQAKVASLNADKVDGVDFPLSGRVGVDPPSLAPHSCVQTSVTIPGKQATRACCSLRATSAPV
jgi:hypothetical protein